MSIITKEQAKDLRNAFDCWQQDYDPVEDKEQYDMFGLGMVAMDALLASLEAEPVAYVIQDRYERQNDDPGYLSRSHVTKYVSDDDIQEHEITCTPLYTAPPAPVSDSLISELLAIAKKAAEEADECAHAEWNDDSMEHSAAISDWERRAAMLQGADGNSPVIPDCWVACSERMPNVGDIVLTAMGESVNVGEMERSGANYRFFTSVISGRELPATHWMPLPAAPQQEAKNV